MISKELEDRNKEKKQSNGSLSLQMQEQKDIHEAHEFPFVPLLATKQDIWDRLASFYGIQGFPADQLVF